MIMKSLPVYCSLSPSLRPRASQSNQKAVGSTRSPFPAFTSCFSGPRIPMTTEGGERQKQDEKEKRNKPTGGKKERREERSSLWGRGMLPLRFLPSVICLPETGRLNNNRAPAPVDSQGNVCSGQVTTQANRSAHCLTLSYFLFNYQPAFPCFGLG